MNFRKHKATLKTHLDACMPVLIKKFGDRGAADFIQCALENFDSIAPEFPVFKCRYNRLNFTFTARFLFPVYRTLLDRFSYTKDDAFAFLSVLTEIACRYHLEHTNPFMKLAYRLLGHIWILRYPMRMFFKYKKERYGWQATLYNCKDVYLSADITECGLYDWLKERGVAEICILACKMDFVTMEYMPGLRLLREKTIAQGDGVCTFRYYKKAKESVTT